MRDMLCNSHAEFSAARTILAIVGLMVLLVGGCRTMEKNHNPSEATNRSQTQSSQYKGWTTIRGERTGFFHVEQVQDKWWIIDPDGCAFLSVGVNHVGVRECMSPHNFVPFEKKFGSSEGARGAQEITKTPFFAGFKKMVEEDFDYLHINTSHFTGKECLPTNCAYFVAFGQILPFADWLRAEQVRHPDIFDPEIQRQLESDIARICLEVKDDPSLLGYCFVDVPLYLAEFAARKKANTWQQDIQDLGRGAPGKREFVELMRSRYDDDITVFNSIYGTACTDFDDIYDLKAETLSNPKTGMRPRDDDRMFFRKILEAYYQFMHDTIRKYDPNHMILGDRFNGNSGTPEFALDIAAKWIDVFMVQYYGIYEDQAYDLDRWHRITGKPIILCDSCFCVPYEQMPSPYGYRVKDQKARGEAYEKYARSVYALPYVVGWSWCGYIDNWESVEPGRQHSGIKDAFGERYTDLTAVMHRVNSEAYRIHSAGQ